MFLKNLTLNIEDEDIVSNSEPIEVTPESSALDDVDNVDGTSDYQETIVATEEVLSDINEQTDVMNTLEESADNLEEKMNSDEGVSVGDIVVAQEAFVFALGRLANSSIALQDYRRTMHFEDELTDSSETIIEEDGGLEKQITNEVEMIKNNYNKPIGLGWKIVHNIKTFILNIVASIRTLFSKLSNFIKKLIIKITVMFGSYSKTLEKIKTTCNGNNQGAVNIEAARKAAFDKMGGLLYSTMYSSNSPCSISRAFSLSNQITKFGVVAPSIVTKAIEEISQWFSSIQGILSSVVTDVASVGSQAKHAYHMGENMREYGKNFLDDLTGEDGRLSIDKVFDIFSSTRDKIAQLSKDNEIPDTMKMAILKSPVAEVAQRFGVDSPEDGEAIMAAWSIDEIIKHTHFFLLEANGNNVAYITMSDPKKLAEKKKDVEKKGIKFPTGSLLSVFFGDFYKVGGIVHKKVTADETKDLKIEELDRVSTFGDLLPIIEKHQKVVDNVKNYINDVEVSNKASDIVMSSLKKLINTILEYSSIPDSHVTRMIKDIVIAIQLLINNLVSRICLALIRTRVSLIRGFVAMLAGGLKTENK